MGHMSKNQQQAEVKSLSIEDNKKHIQEIFSHIISWFSLIASYEYYDSKYGIINKSLFWSDHKWPITIEDIKIKHYEIRSKKFMIKDLIKYTSQDNHIWETTKSVYLNSLENIDNIYDLLSHSVYFEAEKWWYILTKEEKEFHYDKVIELQKKVYGPQISDTPKEREKVIKKLTQTFDLKKENLTISEQEEFKNFLMEINNKFDYDYKNTIDISWKKIEKSEKKIENQTIEFIKKNPSIDLTLTQKIEKKVFDFYDLQKKWSKITLKDWSTWVHWKSANSVIHSKRKSMSPNDWKNITIDKLLSIKISHEIEKHVLMWENTNHHLWLGFFGKDYQIVEETLATKIHEGITNWTLSSYEDLPKLLETVNSSFIWTFIAENFNLKDASKFYWLYVKLINPKSKTDIGKFMERRKNHYPFDMKGANTWETKYQRGTDTVIEDFINAWSLENAISLYKNMSIFKLWIDDIKKVPLLRKELNVSDDELFFPLFVGKILKDKLIKWKGSINNYEKIFWRNYKEIMNIKTISYQAKRNLVEILDLLPKPATHHV